MPTRTELAAASTQDVAANNSLADLAARRRRYPIPDQRRCEALAHPNDNPRYCPDWQRGVHRCGLSGTHVRDGRKVCRAHRDCERVAYFDPHDPPTPPPIPPEPPIPRKYQADIAHLELHIEAAERLDRMADAALHASNWKRLAHLVDRLANEIDAIYAAEWPRIRQASELTPRANDLSMSLMGFDHELAQERRNRRRGRQS